MGRVLIDFDVSVGLMHRESREILLLNLLLGSASKVLFFALIATIGRFPVNRALDPGHLF